MLPHDLAREVERGAAHVAKVDEQPVARDDGRGAGEGVLLVHGGGGSGGSLENLGVPKEASIFCIEAEGVKCRAALGFAEGCGEVDFPRSDDGGGPAFAGHFDFPRDVFGGAPFQRDAGGGGDSLPRLAAKLRPVALGGKGG